MIEFNITIVFREAYWSLCKYFGFSFKVEGTSDNSSLPFAAITTWLLSQVFGIASTCMRIDDKWETVFWRRHDPVVAIIWDIVLEQTNLGLREEGRQVENTIYYIKSGSES